MKFGKINVFIVLDCLIWFIHIEKARDRRQQESARVQIGCFQVLVRLGSIWWQAKTVYALTSLDGFTQPIQLKQSLGCWETSKTQSKHRYTLRLLCKSTHDICDMVMLAMHVCMNIGLPFSLPSNHGSQGHSCSIVADIAQLLHREKHAQLFNLMQLQKLILREW